ncbi:MAG: hemerythrin domain-containing protein [Planctomycetales bacterium]|nr:hemerythrin domain-containing protein [Planctomycetales bacterium]
MNLPEYLSRHNVRFERIEHSPSYSAHAMAAALHVSGEDVAKTVALVVEREHGENRQAFVVAVVPATMDVNLESIRRILRAAQVDLATEEAIQARFPDCELGAVPAFGSAYGMQTIVDISVAQKQTILFEGGTHCESIRMQYEDFENLETPIVAPIATRQPESGGHSHETSEPTSESELVREFLVDHQRMSQLLVDVISQLENRDLEHARDVGRQLDGVAGAHIRFEEKDLYPRISAHTADSDYTDELYAEHREAATALKLLIDEPNPSEESIKTILSGLKTGLRHAEHCGSLVSVLDQLPAAEQETSLRFLQECRREKGRWTDTVQ